MGQHSKILASSWTDGVFILDSDGLSHELPKRTVRGLSDDLAGGAFAVVDEHHLFRRELTGQWHCVASSGYVLSVTFAVEHKVYVGTDDARVLVLDDQGKLNQIDCFDSIHGRDSWFAGTAIVDGKEVGPPLGIRSLSGSVNGCIFANVHIGGIPRSVDGGVTWEPTIDVGFDAHEVRVSPSNTNLVVAATASGLCISWDGGESWSVQSAGLHAPYCSAIAVTAEHIFVAASENHFSPQGAIYRRSVVPFRDHLEKVGAGLPDWLAGIVDTSCIASSSDEMALASARRELFTSVDAGRNWIKRDETVAGISSVLIVR